MLATLCGLIALSQEGDIVQKELPNGAKYRIERVSDSGQVMAALYVDESNLPQDGGTSGTRHLLEHLIAKGGDRQLDRRLESVGLSLTAFTERDGTAFVIMGPSSQAVAAVQSLADLLEPLDVPEAELANEVKIIDQEGVFRDRFSRFLDAAWLKLFDPPVESIHGNIGALAQLTPADLKGAAEAYRAAGGLSVFVRGEVEPGPVSLRLQEILGAASPGKSRYQTRNVLESIGMKETVKAKGAARAVVAAGLDRPMTLARIGVALAMQGLEPGFSTVYEPSFNRGALLLFSEDARSFESLGKYGVGDVPRLAPFVRLQAVRFVSGLLTEGPAYGALRAKQVRQAPAFKIESLRSTAVGLTDQEIWSALQDWQGGALHIGGTQ